MAEGTVAADQLRLFIERIERLEEEKKGIAGRRPRRLCGGEVQRLRHQTTMRAIVRLQEDGDARPPGAGRLLGRPIARR